MSQARERNQQYLEKQRGSKMNTEKPNRRAEIKNH